MKQRSLKFRLISSFFGVAIICAMLGAFGCYITKNLSGDVREIGDVLLPSVQALGELAGAQADISAGESALLIAGISDKDRKDILARFEVAMKTANEAWDLYSKLDKSGEEEIIYKELVPAWKEWVNEHNNLMEDDVNYHNNKSEKLFLHMSEQYFGKTKESFIKAETLLERLVDLNRDEAIAVSNSVKKEADQFMGMSIVGLIIGFALAIILGAIISNSISISLLNLSEKLGNASGEVANASEQLSVASQNLSTGSSQQASSIEETTANLQEMTGMIETNLKSAEKSQEIANTVKEIATKGNQAMNSLVSSIQEIQVANQDIDKLVKVIAEIGDKTKIIDEIVFQTKLLSFNASVEAERAGEHGRGFAVVAQEVGNLAQMSGKAAKEISGIVKESIKSAENIALENRRKVEKGSSLVKETAVILNETAEKIAVVTSSASQVVEASREQSAGVKQISKAMDQLNIATQGSAATAQQAASSSEELAAQAANMSEIVVKLNQLVKGNQATSI